MKAGWAAAALVAVAVTGCSSQSPPPTDLSHDLAARITVDAMYTHLHKLADIAEANGGNRAEGTPGYDASLDYVSKLLKDKGFDVQTPEFDRLGPMQGGDPALVVDGTRYPVVQGSLLVQTPPGGLNAPTLHPTKLTGCTAADYGSKKMTGAIAVVDDTGCSVVVKQDTAVAQGAVGLLVVSTVKPSPTGLFTPGYYRQLKVPVGIIEKSADTALLGTSAAVKLTLDGKSELIKSRNLVAQTKTGSTSDVVMAGAHLDSIRGGPGINDNATGVAALLETALQLGGSPAVHNAVRFAFWGGQETGVDGSTQYVKGLDAGQLADVALYLNFEMLGSTNAGYFTYDGDQSAATTTVKSVPDGSAGIERTLAGYLNLAGVRPADMPLSDTTDYTAFLAAGVPIGGTTTGSSQRKTEVQARLWGGKAGQPFDPNYHTPRDTVDNVDAHALSIMGPAAAFAVGSYAMSIDGVNGVPSHDKRNRRPR
ncbi:peptidase M28 [Mycobacterium sp. 852013-50091_SCH5140682]|uniref:M28 family peptidase n=1 Tax=Mycobacterium sp. 852013-50091_SCH5140682 TaxID=1834109 RepID=UPI0007E9C429|nr:M28 family peptidase [Mycobacterium sp. 852013-50091_SCH5140682]OBC13002.1 peptidase M28 [Mycobacterium sp. 852013-50091_SCH5140682]